MAAGIGLWQQEPAVVNHHEGSPCFNVCYRITDKAKWQSKCEHMSSLRRNSGSPMQQKGIRQRSFNSYFGTGLPELSRLPVNFILQPRLPLDL